MKEQYVKPEMEIKELKETGVPTFDSWEVVLPDVPLGLEQRKKYIIQKHYEGE